MRGMAGRAIRITSRILFAVCGLVTLVTAAPYVMLRGIDLPVQSEWIIFVVVLGLIAVWSLVAAVLPRSWLARVIKSDRNDEIVFSIPLKFVGGFAAVAYLIALVAYFAPHNWDLNSQLMLVLCPMYFVKMTVDPSTSQTFLMLAPMNAAVFGSLGLTVGHLCLALRQ